MDIDLVELWASMNMLVRSVVIVLTAQAIFSITVVVDRLLMLFRAKRGEAALVDAIDEAVIHNKPTLVKDAVRTDRPGFLNPVVGETLQAVERFGEKESRATKTSAENVFALAGRVRERALDKASASIHRGMNVLASTGSTAPFIGLLGTVLGILNAFKLIAKDGSGGMGTIGAAIGEALIVTGYGLMVAIPAVLLFNWISGKLNNYEGEIDRLSAESLDLFEGSHTNNRARPLAALLRARRQNLAHPI